MQVQLSDLVARNARAERARHRWSQADLAARWGTSQSTVSQLETGGRTVSLDDTLELCAALQVPLVRLLLGATREQLQVLGLPVKCG